MLRRRLGLPLLGLLLALTGCGSSSDAPTARFQSGNLLVSRTVYAGTAATVSVGQALPGGGVAIADGTFPTCSTTGSPILRSA